MKKNVLLALGAILGSSAAANAVESTPINTEVSNSESTLNYREAPKKSKSFLLKIDFNNIENSMACFHTSHSSHSSHSSHASHSSHSSSSFV